MHAPVCPSNCEDKQQLREDTWRQLELLLDEGYVRAIGVSNFAKCHLEELLDNCGSHPQVNQIEVNPYQNPSELQAFCIKKGIQLQGYCPLAKGRILTERPITEIAAKQGKTPAQILIRWCIQKNVPTIPKSTKPARILENSQVFDFELTDEDMATLNGLHDGRRSVDLIHFQEKIDNPLPDGYKLGLPPFQQTSTNKVASCENNIQ